MSDAAGEQLERIVRGILAENAARRSEWSDQLRELIEALADGRDLPIGRFEELLNGHRDAEPDPAAESPDGPGADG